MANTTSLLLLTLFIFTNVRCATQTPTASSAKRAPQGQGQDVAAVVTSAQSAPDALQDVVRLDQKYFITYYNKSLRLPEFSAYTLTAEHLKQGTVKRKNHFHADRQLQDMGLSPVGPKDYAGSGYDRGHMAPSGDFTWSEAANEATFVMSNMAPQKPGLNRQAWRILEEKVRHWACAAGSLRVITGPILTSTTPFAKLDTGVVVPQKFYKIIIDENPPMKAIGFVMAQDDSSHDTFEKAHQPIKDIEATTQIDFFALSSGPALADRNRLENDDDLTEWKEADCAPTAKPAAPPAAAQAPAGESAPAAAASAAKACTAGVLKPAVISGCCRGHQGVMGPKKAHACCDESNQVMCNDGTPDSRCTCN